jgi:hypothetical protein
MLRKLCWLVVAPLILPIAALAQTGNVVPYAWEAADLALAYPAGWDEPLPSDADGQLVLQMAQTLVDSPDIRPPGVPIITLTVTTPQEAETDVLPPLQAAFDTLQMTPGEPSSTILMGVNGQAVSGVSDDELLFAVGRAAVLPDSRVLVVTGRAPSAQRDDFLQLFDAVTNSLVLGAGSAPVTPSYGVLWFTERTLDDGANAFVNLVGMGYAGGLLYTTDPFLGVIQLDAVSGDVLATFANENLTAPSDLAVDSAGNVYVADIACQCILVLAADGTWLDPMGEFGAGAPVSITIASDDTLYATDQTDANIEVRVFAGGEESNITFGEEVTAQPALAADHAGRILAVTVDGLLLTLQGGQFVPQGALTALTSVATDAAVDTNNNLVLATNGEGILIVNSNGEEVERLGRLVANFPLPGEVVSPVSVTVSADGTIYWADSDGTFGAVTAMSTRVESGRIGATTLELDVAVQGTLSETSPQQRWTFNAIAGQRVTISAVEAVRDSGLDMAVHLLAPDGSEEAYNDDHAGIDLYSAFDAQIRLHTFAASGAYTIAVEWVGGQGTYSLGISGDRPLELSSDGVTRVEGHLQDVFPTQRWVFEAQAGQVFTFTMQAAPDTALDSVLRLLDPDGELVATNDDAADPALGLDSQLVQVELPRDGIYTIEASRFDGEGAYTLVIVATT